MATEGKVPLLGFKAAAIKFVTLLGFSPKPHTLAPRVVDLAASYVPIEELPAAYDATVGHAASYSAIVELEASVGD